MIHETNVSLNVQEVGILLSALKLLEFEDESCPAELVGSGEGGPLHPIARAGLGLVRGPGHSPVRCGCSGGRGKYRRW